MLHLVVVVGVVFHYVYLSFIAFLNFTADNYSWYVPVGGLFLIYLLLTGAH